MEIKYIFPESIFAHTGGCGDCPAPLAIGYLHHVAGRYRSRCGPGATFSFRGTYFTLQLFIIIVVILQVVVQQLGFPKGFRAAWNLTLELIMVQVNQRLIRRHGVIRSLGIYYWKGNGVESKKLFLSITINAK